MHSALGIAHGVNEPVARKLADQGYLAVCTDMYGADLEGASMEDAGLAYGQNLADPDRQRVDVPNERQQETVVLLAPACRVR